MAERLRVDIDSESYRRLQEIAVKERRPVGWQAEVLLIRAIAEYCAPVLRPDPSERESFVVSEK
jgi:hypothetical protein